MSRRRRCGRDPRRWLAAALLTLPLACGPANPLLGEWEVDRDATSAGVLALVRQTGDDRVIFEEERVLLGPTELPVRYEIEEDRVRLIRTDRDFEHEVDLLASGMIRVHYPAGYTAVYRRAGT